MNQDNYQDELREHRPPPQKSKSPLMLILGIVGGLFVLFLLCAGGLFALLYPAVEQARTAARSSVSRSNLKKIALAMHNYHDMEKSFPPGATVNEEGVAYHSWMTQLLPYLDQTPLYQSIDFEVPWDDAANYAAFSAINQVFINPEIEGELTVDGYAVSHYAGNASILFDNSHIRFRDIIDGASNTIMGGEIKTNIPAWGNPANRRDLSLNKYRP